MINPYPRELDDIVDSDYVQQFQVAQYIELSGDADTDACQLYSQAIEKILTEPNTALLCSFLDNISKKYSQVKHKNMVKNAAEIGVVAGASMFGTVPGIFAGVAVGLGKLYTYLAK